MTIATLPLLPTPPNSITRPGSFNADSDATFAQLPAVVDAFNANVPLLNALTAEAAATVAQVELLVDEAQTAKSDALAASAAAAASAHFKGLWSTLSGALAQPATVHHAGQNWLLVANLADVAAHQPGVSAAWVPALVLKTINGESIVGTGNLELSGGIEATVVQRSFVSGEQRMIALTEPVDGAALVSVQREIPQLGVSTNFWQSVIASGDFIFEDFAPAVAITIGAAVNSVVPITLAAGAWSAVDVGRRLQGAGGVAVIQSYAGAVAQAFVVTAFTSGGAAAGAWSLFGTSVQDGRLCLGTKAGRNYAFEEAAYVRTSPAGMGSDASYCMSISDDGNYLFLGGYSSFKRYTLIAPWNISNWSAQATLASIPQHPYYGGIKVCNGGNRLWVLRSINTDMLIYEYLLTVPNGTAYTVGKTSANNAFTGNDRTSLKGLVVSADGFHIYAMRDVSGVISVLHWELTTAWDLATMAGSPNQTLTPFPNVSGILEISADGKALYFGSSTSAQIVVLRLPTAYSLAGAVADASPYVLPSFPGTTVGALVSGDLGRRVYATNNSNVYQYDVSGTVIPTGVNYPAIYATGVDTEFWTAARDLVVVGDEGTAYYAMSTDNRVTWHVSTRADGLRAIARVQAGVWQINSNVAYTGTTWTNATTHTELAALRQAVTDIAANRMTKTALVAGRSYDLASITSGSVTSNNTTVSNWSTSGSGDYNMNLVYAPDGQRFQTFDSSSSTNGSIRIREWTPTEAWGIVATGSSTNFTLGGTQRTDSYHWLYRMFKTQWSDNGLHLYVAKGANSGEGSAVEVLRFTTSAAGRAANLTLTPAQTLSAATLSGLAGGASFTYVGAFCVAAGGTRLYIADAANRIHQFNMPTPYTFTGLTYGGSFVFGSPTNYTTMRMTPDGKTAFVSGQYSANSIRELALATAFDITTASLVTTHTLPSWSGENFEFGQSGSYIYALAGTVGGSISTLRRASTPLGGLLPMPVLGDKLDIAVTLASASVNVGANTQGLGVTYDANTSWEPLLPGTHFTYTQPSSTKVLFKALTTGNLKVRIA